MMSNEMFCACHFQSRWSTHVKRHYDKIMWTDSSWRTFSSASTEAALELASTIDEHHERTHVRLTSVTPNWTHLTEVDDRQWQLKPSHQQQPFYGQNTEYLLANIPSQELVDSVGAQFCCLMPLADCNWHIGLQKPQRLPAPLLTMTNYNFYLTSLLF